MVGLHSPVGWASRTTKDKEIQTRKAREQPVDGANKDPREEGMKEVEWYQGRVCIKWNESM